MDKLITALLEERGLSLTELTMMLGYQSKTSLVRIMKNQASRRALDTFEKRMNERLELTEEERAHLEKTMDHLRWQEDYDSSQEMLRFLRGEPAEDDEIWLENAETGDMRLLSERYAEATEISIMLLNCQYVPIFSFLLDLVRQKGATVEHYMLMREDSARVIRALHVLIPLIYEKNYSGYSYRKSDFGRIAGASGVLSGDMMTVRYRSAGGETCEDVVVFDRMGHGYVHAAPQTGSFQRMLGVRKSEYEPIKNTYFQDMQLDGYIRFCGEYAKLEHNRYVLKIKPDIGFECIPADILINAMQESSIHETPDAKELLEAFRKVHTERVCNVYEKRRVTRMILKRSAMVRFARTGRLSDHVWAMRPFTKEERVRILSLLAESEENNPYFNISFLKDNDFLRDAEIAYYDGVGVLVTEADTDYSLKGNHSEVMLVHGGFMRMFKEYYERSLMAEQISTRAETAAFLNELIRIAMSEG